MQLASRAAAIEDRVSILPPVLVKMGHVSLPATALALAFALLLSARPAVGASPDEWASRTIYQLLTDRWAYQGPEPWPDCPDLSDYCGGTFNGTIQVCAACLGLVLLSRTASAATAGLF